MYIHGAIRRARPLGKIGCSSPSGSRAEKRRERREKRQKLWCVVPARRESKAIEAIEAVQSGIRGRDAKMRLERPDDEWQDRGLVRAGGYFVFVVRSCSFFSLFSHRATASNGT